MKSLAARTLIALCAAYASPAFAAVAIFEKGVKGMSDTRLTSGQPEQFNPTIWAQSPSMNASIDNGYPHLIAKPPM